MSSTTLKLPVFRRRILPGFGLSLGFTLAYLGLIVLIPLSAAFLRTSGMTWEDQRAAAPAGEVRCSRGWLNCCHAWGSSRSVVLMAQE